MTEHTIATATHGRYLVQPPSRPAPQPPSRPVAQPPSFLVGFHGYMESAELQMDRLRSVPGSDAWTLVSIQGLNRFYRGRKSQDVVAGWMTRQDRELSIADNIAYVAAVIAEVTRDAPKPPGVLFSGFSQGVAMAFRAACASLGRVLGVVGLGSDVPPELGSDALGRIPVVLLGRGARDEIYPPAQWQADRARLEAAGVGDLRVHQSDAGHEWTDDFSREVGRLLADVRAR